jgi:hypothetical protein
VTVERDLADWILDSLAAFAAIAAIVAIILAVRAERRTAQALVRERRLDFELALLVQIADHASGHPGIPGWTTNYEHCFSLCLAMQKFGSRGLS